MVIDHILEQLLEKSVSNYNGYSLTSELGNPAVLYFANDTVVIVKYNERYGHASYTFSRLMFNVII